MSETKTETEETSNFRAEIYFSPVNVVVVGDMWPIDDFFDLLCGISLDKSHTNVNSLLLKYLKTYETITPAQLKAFIKNKSRIPREELLSKIEGSASEKDNAMFEILNAFQTKLCGNPGRRDYSPYLNISEKRGPNDEEYIYISRVKTLVMFNDSALIFFELVNYKLE